MRSMRAGLFMYIFQSNTRGPFVQSQLFLPDHSCKLTTTHGPKLLISSTGRFQWIYIQARLEVRISRWFRMAYRTMTKQVKYAPQQFQDGASFGIWLFFHYICFHCPVCDFTYGGSNELEGNAIMILSNPWATAMIPYLLFQFQWGWHIPNVLGRRSWISSPSHPLI